MSRMVPAHLTGCFCLPDLQAFFLSELSSHFMAVFSHCGHVASVAAPITGTTYNIMQETLIHRNRIWVWNGQQHRCIRVTKCILLFSSGSERPFQREFDTVLSLQHAQHNKRLIFGEKNLNVIFFLYNWYSTQKNVKDFTWSNFCCCQKFLLHKALCLYVEVRLWFWQLCCYSKVCDFLLALEMSGQITVWIISFWVLWTITVSQVDVRKSFLSSLHLLETNYFNLAVVKVMPYSLFSLHPVVSKLWSCKLQVFIWYPSN